MSLGHIKDSPAESYLDWGKLIMVKKTEIVKAVWRIRSWINIKLVWALFKARNYILAIVKEIKKRMDTTENTKRNEPGMFTTEFFVVIISNAIGIVGALKGVIGPEWTAAALGILNAIYSILRTIRKTSADKVKVAELAGR